MSLRRWIPKITLLAMALAPAISPGAEKDPEKIQGLIASYVSDLEGASMTASGGGLKLTAAILPDALAYRIAREYLRLRKAGRDHEAAVRELAVSYPRWKRRLGLAGVWLKMENQKPRIGSSRDLVQKQRIFTLQENFAKKAVVLLNGKKKRIPARLAEAPLNLRVAQLRVKKFWTTSDHNTRRRAYDPNDPASIGRVPKLSKPFPALLLEDRPAEAELLFKAGDKRGFPQVLYFKQFKIYEGPFKKNLLDLNMGRRWDFIEPIILKLRLPPTGLEQPSALIRLVQEVKKAGSSL
jgi:hypothetical protein